MIAALVLAAATSFGDLTMRVVGPAVAGGRIAAVAGTAQNDKLYYLGTAGGGVWRSQNGGATWSPVFDQQDVSAIGAVSIDPTNQDAFGWEPAKRTRATTSAMAMVCTRPLTAANIGNALVCKMYGASRASPLIRAIPSTSSSPDSATRSKIRAIAGVYATFDGGKTLSKSLYVDEKTGASDLAMDPRNPSVIYAGMWTFRRVPWTFTSGSDVGGLYKSTDGGKTWKKLTGNGLPTGMTGRIGLAIAPSQPSSVYAMIEAKGGMLWRSDDAGAHWKMVSDDSIVDQRPFYFSHVEVDPKNPDHVYAVSNDLAESKDGGKKFEQIAKSVHVDFHAIWIASNDPDRVIIGADGGYAITLDGGKNWSFAQNLPIGQIYHVGYSLGTNPYSICASLQDNEAFCGPSNSLSGDGILNSDWYNVVGGDGEWAWPDPSDPRYIWADLEDGVTLVNDTKTQSAISVRPWDAFPSGTLGPFDSRPAKYRFNWDSPINFAPWDPHIAWLGGNVVFQSTDRGLHWTVISPDLTRNVKDHQLPAGGPLAQDVSGAEYSDNLLDIEGSPVTKGEIWTGSDDGVISLTRDGGANWTTVTPQGAPEYARMASVSPSPFAAGTAYAIADNHMLGDYKPYIYVTHDYGKSWTLIVDGIPGNQYARAVRADAVNPDIVYAGTENGLWISYDKGAHFENFRLNMPPTAVYDIRVQPEFNDLIVGTHGRDVWVLDDLTPVQALPQAQKAGVMLFKLRTAYQYHQHSNEDYGAYTNFSAENPPSGAILNYYLAAPQKKNATVQIVDANGKVIRTISGTHKVEGKDVPNVPNKTGINRMTWDLHESGPTPWNGAGAPEFRGPRVGPMVLPGVYTLRLQLDGTTLSQTVTVKPDPRDSWSTADLQAAYDFAKKYNTRYSKIDEALNNLDAIKKSLDKANASDPKIAAAKAQWQDVFSTLTANFKNGEDSVEHPGSLREEVPRTGFGAAAPPTAAQLDYASRWDAAYDAAFAKYNEYVKSLGSLKLDGAKTVTP